MKYALILLDLDETLLCSDKTISDYTVRILKKFSKANATKEAAISYLAKYLQISCEKMIAFGDDFSDMGMLQMCGTGVAMGNAIPEVKEIADAVTKSNNEDGVAYYLEQKLL